MGWGTEDAAGAGSQEEEDVAAVVKTTAGGGAEQECPVGSGLRLHVSELPPLIVQEGGFAFPL